MDPPVSPTAFASTQDEFAALSVGGGGAPLGMATATNAQLPTIQHDSGGAPLGMSAATIRQVPTITTAGLSQPPQGNGTGGTGSLVPTLPATNQSSTTTAGSTRQVTFDSMPNTKGSTNVAATIGNANNHSEQQEAEQQQQQQQTANKQTSLINIFLYFVGGLLPLGRAAPAANGSSTASANTLAQSSWEPGLNQLENGNKSAFDGDGKTGVAKRSTSIGDEPMTGSSSSHPKDQKAEIANGTTEGGMKCLLFAVLFCCARWLVSNKFVFASIYFELQAE